MINYASAQTTFGLRIGGNFAGISGAVPIDARTGVTASPKPGIQIGTLGKSEVAERLSFQYGLVFVQQGCKFVSSFENFTWNIDYLQVPFNMQVNFGRFFVQSGVYFGYALTGKAKSDGNKDASLFEIEKYGGAMKRFDAGIDSRLGLEFGAFQIGLGSSLGLMNLFNSDDFKGTFQNQINTKNFALSISLAYFFGNSNSFQHHSHSSRRW